MHENTVNPYRPTDLRHILNTPQQDNRRLRERLDSALNADSQWRMRGRLSGVSSLAVAVCAPLGNNGTAYMTKNFIDALDQNHPGNPVFEDALRAMATMNGTTIQEIFNHGFFSYTGRDNVNYEVKLKYEREHNDNLSQARITDLNIYKGPDKVFPSVAPAQTSSNSSSSTSLTPMQPQPQFSSSANRVRTMIVQQTISQVSSMSSTPTSLTTGQLPPVYAANVGRTGSSTSSNTAVGGRFTPIAPYPAAIPSSSTVTASTPSAAGSQPPAGALTVSPTVLAALRNATADNASATHQSLFGSGAFGHDKDTWQFSRFIGFLEEKQPSETLADAMANFETFRQRKEEFLRTKISDNDDEKYDFIGLFNRMRQACFRLPAKEAVENDPLWRRFGEGDRLVRSTCAGHFDELLAANGLSFDQLKTSKDGNAFNAYKAALMREYPGRDTEWVLGVLEKEIFT
jgi:hypothetical protein